VSRWLFRTSLIPALLAACGSAPTESRLPRTAHPNRSIERKAPSAHGFPAMQAHRFAEVTDVVGPYVGRAGDSTLAAWAEVGGNGRTLFASRIDGRGRPGEPMRIASLASSLDLMLVRGFGAAGAMAEKSRFAVITTRRSEQKNSIDITALTADAKAVWGPTSVVERPSPILWVGFVAAGSDSLLLWAEQASGAKPGEPASVLGVSVTVDGKVGTPTVINPKACVWQAASLGPRAALASVKPGPTGCGNGSVALDLLGPGAKVEKSIELGGHAGLDLDLVAGPDAFVLAWSDRQQIEPRVVTALVDGKGTVRAPAAPAVPAIGEQAVIALAGGSSAGPAAFLLWENVAERPEGARTFEVSSLDADGRVSGRARLLYGRADGSTPELASYGDGLAALTLAPACHLDDDCDGSPVVPTFVAFDSALHVRTSEPLILDALSGRAADLGWGLSCNGDGCFSLAALSRSPAALFSVALPLRENPYRAAAEESTPLAKPRVISSEALLRAAAPLSEIAIGELSGRSLVGYVTDFDPTTPWQKLTKPAEDGRLEPLRARIALRAYGNEPAHAPLADEQLLSLRAHSLGGLCLLGDGASGKEGVAIWAGLDKGEPQVFLTALGADGKRGQQRMLTRKTGEASDVAGLAIDGGYLVAWVDERSGDAEVFATRVARSLEKTSPEQRITLADGAASQLLLTRVAGKPYALWADARGAQEPGWADIYGAFLRPSDAARDGAEHRLSSTRPHSFSPEASQLGNTPIVAWLEEAADAQPASVRIASLSPSGDVTGNVSSIPIAAGAPRGLGIACGDVSCRVAVTVEVEGRGELQGFEWRPSTESRVSRLAGLNGPSSVAVAPLVRGNVVYVADSRDGQGLVRRLGIEW
jgi:hypothetical protein